MIFSSLRLVREPSRPILLKLYLRRLLGRRELVFLTVALLLNALYNNKIIVLLGAYIWNLPGGGRMQWMDELAFNMLASVDLFSFALVMVLADFMRAARRDRLFEELSMTGISWRAIYAPLFEILAIALVVDAWIELLVPLPWSQDPAWSRIPSLLTGGVCGVAMAASVASIMLVLSVRGFGRIVQMAALFLLNLMILSGLGVLSQRIALRSWGKPEPALLGWWKSFFAPGPPGTLGTEMYGWLLATLAATALLFLFVLLVDLCAGYLLRPRES